MTDNVIEFSLDLFFSGVLGLLAWFFGGFDVLLKVLIVMIVIDYATGLSIAWLDNALCSSVGFRGITKKCIMLSFVGIAHLMDMIIPDDHGAIRSIVCLFYISNEGKSIIENAHRLGVPFPNELLKHFDFIHKDEKITCDKSVSE